MKNLMIVRHSKSSWDHDVIDHERPLNSRGENDAKAVSQYLKSFSLNPDLILSSDALRAKTTADIFIENLNFNKIDVKLNHDLYDFAGHNLIKVIKSCNDSIDKLMIFGHNHAITAFVNAYGNKHIDNVPTSGFVQMEFENDSWKDLKPGKTLISVFPRDLKD